jgi:hypothetical protein
MPRPLQSPFGKRQPRALVIGLRSVVKDPKATVTQRFEACKLLAVIEGYIEGPSQAHARAETEITKELKSTPAHPPITGENTNRLRQLLATTSEAA